MVLIWSTSEVWKAESNFYPPSGCELGTSGKETEPPKPLRVCSIIPSECCLCKTLLFLVAEFHEN